MVENSLFLWDFFKMKKSQNIRNRPIVSLSKETFFKFPAMWLVENSLFPWDFFKMHKEPISQIIRNRPFEINFDNNWCNCQNYVLLNKKSPYLWLLIFGIYINVKHSCLWVVYISSGITMTGFFWISSGVPGVRMIKHS